MIVDLAFLWARNIGVNSDPSAREYCDKATPDDAPNRATMCEVSAVI